MAAVARLADVERRIDELSRVRDSLRQLIAACPILNALSQEAKS